MDKEIQKEIAEDKKSSKPVIVSEGTLVPLSMVISIIGFSAWITYVAHTASANAQNIREMKANDSAVVKELRAMNTRLSRIEGKLDGLRTRR